MYSQGFSLRMNKILLVLTMTTSWKSDSKNQTSMIPIIKEMLNHTTVYMYGYSHNTNIHIFAYIDYLSCQKGWMDMDYLVLLAHWCSLDLISPLFTKHLQAGLDAYHLNFSTPLGQRSLTWPVLDVCLVCQRSVWVWLFQFQKEF